MKRLVDEMAGTTRLELATSAVTGQRSNQLNYVPACAVQSPKRRGGRIQTLFCTRDQDGGQCRTRTCDPLLVRQVL